MAILDRSKLQNRKVADGYVAPSVSAGHIGAVSDPDRVYGSDYTHKAIQTSGSASSAAARAAAARAAAQASALANPILASLGQLDTILGNRYAQAEGDYSQATAGYDDQMAADRAAHQRQVTQNESNLANQRQAALLSAAQGASGLRGVLASLGALGGTGSELMARAVRDSANRDIGAADETFQTNAESLNTAWGQAEREDRQRRLDAERIRKAARQSAESDILKSRQSMYQDLSNIYGAGTGQGQSYASKAGALAGEIAGKTAPVVGQYAKSSSLFSPQALQQYLAGTQDLSVGAQGGSATPTNSPLYAIQGRKKEELV